MSYDAFERMILGLGESVKVFVADLNGSVQGCAVIPFSKQSAYYSYGGTASESLNGATNLLQWEAMRYFRALGVKCYDFCGVRINPEKGSKAAGLMMYKERFGSQLLRGYMWKYPLHPLKSAIYSWAIRMLRGGDIVDRERHKLDLLCEMDSVSQVRQLQTPS
jgi:lipid II:glycine glycyltransferase (peptidoglycan interpeptide bridge formation enzyme)